MCQMDKNNLGDNHDRGPTTTTTTGQRTTRTITTAAKATASVPRFRPRNPFQIDRPDEEAFPYEEEVTDDEDENDNDHSDGDERERFLESEPNGGGFHNGRSHICSSEGSTGVEGRGGCGWRWVALAMMSISVILLGWAFFDDSNGRVSLPSPVFHDDELISLRTLNSTFYFPKAKYEQIQNYRQKKALLLHLHLTHHAGTTVCNVVGWPFSAPPFACRVDRHHERLPANLTLDPRFDGGRNPWYANETDTMIDLLRPYYHMVTWEYGVKAPQPRFQVTDWENPRLVSVIVMRDPISRLLSGDGYVASTYHIKNATRDVWWEYATTDHGDTNNVMLHDLSADPGCCQGADTPRERLLEAQALISRFTFVLDVECLDEGLQALLAVLGLDYKPRRRSPKDYPPGSSKERIPFPDVYQFLKERNRLDQELYDWSKNISLVRCADLKP